MTIKDKPKYRAYKPVQATDGLLTWTQHTFDHTVEMTADDEEKLISVLEGIAPEERIKRLQANLDGLQNMTPVIQAHVNEIRAILARLDNHFSFKNRHEADELGRAEMLWQKILILRDMVPHAERGARCLQGSHIGGKMRGEQQTKEKAAKDDVEVIHGRGKVSEIINRLALKKDSMGDYLRPRNELWDMLWGELDLMGLHPVEHFDNEGNPERISYRGGDGRPGEIKFSSFKVMVSTARKS